MYYTHVTQMDTIYMADRALALRIIIECEN